MRSIIFASFVALAFAATPAFERSFEPKTDYHYKFDGLVLSGLPTADSELSQTRISTRARLQLVDDRHIHLQLVNIRVAASHLPETEQYTALNSLEQRELSPEHLELLQLPVRAQLRNGLVSEIQFDKEDAEWSKNLKRAVLNMISCNPTMPTIDAADEKSIDEENTSFFTNEKTIEGDCQVAYTIVRENQKTIITKSINFDKCEMRPVMNYGLRHLSECPECETNAENIRPQTVYTYVLEKELLKEVEVRSLYTVTINGQDVMKTETRSRLVYEESHRIKNQIEKVNGEKEELIYSVRWEQLVEDYFKNGEKAEFNPFTQFKTEQKMEVIKNLLDNVQEFENNMPETTHNLARLVRIFRTASIEQLEKLHNTIYKKADQKIQNFIEHALAVAGTKNTIQHLIHHIEKEDISSIKAAQLLKSIQETSYPSERIADLLIELAKSRVAQNNEIIRQSAWLAAGSVVRGVVVETADQHLVRESKKDIKEKYVTIFFQQFKNADSIYEKVLALKTIGNAGIDTSVYKINDIIVDRQQPLPVRKEAVEALRLLKDVMPRKIQKILLPIYKNRQFSPELRMVSLWRLMETQPEEQLLVQVVSQMEKESNQQVAAFTYQLIQHFAKSTNPCYQRVADVSSRLLTFTRYQPLDQWMSLYAKLPIFAESAQSGVQFDVAALFDKTEYLPKEVSASMESVFGGNWNKYLAQFGFSQQYIDRVLLKTLERLEYFEKSSEEPSVRGRRHQLPINLVKNVAEKLRSVVRTQKMSHDAYAMAYLRYKDMDYAVLPVDAKKIDNFLEEYLQNGKINIKQVIRALTQNSEFEAHQAGYFYETIRKFPTSLGLPMTVTGKIPTVASVEGQLTTEITSSKALINFEVRPSAASTHVYEMRMFTPLFEQGVKTIHTARFFVPLKFETTVSFNADAVINTRFIVPENQKSIVSFSTRPVVFLRFPGLSTFQMVEAEERTVVVPQWQQKTQDVEWVKKIVGVEMTTRGNVLTQWTWENLLMVEQDVEITIENKSERPVEFQAKLTIGTPLKTDLDQIKFNKIFEKEFELKESKTSERREYFQKMIKEITKSQGYKQQLNLELTAPQDQYLNFDFTTICDSNVRVCKFENQIRRSSIAEETKEWTMTAELVAARPTMPSSLRQLREQPHREVQMALIAKWGAQKKSEMVLNAQLQQSKEQKKYGQSLTRSFNGLPEYELLLKAARLNQLDIVAEYKLTPETESAVARFFELIKVYNFWSVSSRQESNEDDRVVARLTVDPISRQFLNITVQTPEQVVEMRNTPISVRLPLPSIAQRSVRHQFNEKTSSVCKVEKTQIRTFDEVIFNAPITPCESIVAKDCSEQATFAVSARLVRENSDEMIVEVTRRSEVVTLQLIDDEMVVKVDGKRCLNKDLEENDVELIGENLVVVRLPEGEVRFDGYTIKTHLPRFLSNNQVCGLCGNNDDEKSNDFVMADNEETDDIEKFHRSYMIKSEKCNWEEKTEKKHYKKIAMDSYDSSDSDEDMDYKMERLSRNDKTEKKQFVEKTQVKEFAHRVCFSLEPVQECRNGLEEKKTTQKKIRFTCLTRHNAEARRLLKEARNQILELNDYPVSYVKPIDVPTQCVEAY